MDLRVKYLVRDTGGTEDVFGNLVGFVTGADGLFYGVVHTDNKLKPVRLDFLRTVKFTSAIQEES